MKLSTKPDGTVELPLTIAKAKVASTYAQLLNDAVKTAEIKGFRKGKAPRDVVEKNLDTSKLYQNVLEHLLPETISAIIKQYHLKIVASPKLTPISMEPDADWKFTLEIATFPQFELGDYKTRIREALRTTKIWLPGQDKPKSVSATSSPKPDSTPEDRQSLSDKRLGKVFDTLLDNISVPIPQMLIDDEVNKALSKLLNQIQKLGLTIDQYLASLNKTSQELRTEYQKTATNSLKLEFILQKISEDLKIEVPDKDIEAMIAAVPDEKTRKNLREPSEKTYIASVLRKRYTIDSLLRLG